MGDGWHGTGCTGTGFLRDFGGKKVIGNGDGGSNADEHVVPGILFADRFQNRLMKKGSPYCNHTDIVVS